MMIKTGTGTMLSMGLFGDVRPQQTQKPERHAVQYGKMHEAIGKQQHQDEFNSETLAMPHFYGVAAPENLAGEAPSTLVSDNHPRGCLRSAGIERGLAYDRQNPALVGVCKVTEHKVERVEADKFDHVSMRHQRLE
jgi:hypothetical protein